MKRLLNILVLILIGQLAYAQIYIKPNNSYGVINNRTRADSTALVPTGCGKPVGVQGLRSKNEKMAGLYYDSCGHKFYTFDPSDSTWYAPPGTIPIDIFIVAGQSNAQGYATTGSNLVTTLPGTVFQWYQGILKAGNDPVGNANVSSAWPQFGKTYYSLTGRRICFVPSAFSGTSQTAAANTGQGTWDTVGNLFDTSIARYNAAIQALRDSGYNPIFKGVLWHQGENDANAINSATITQAAYTAAFAKMIGRYRTALGKQTPFYIFRIGVRVSFSDLGYDSVRQAEMNICNFDSLTTMVFYGAKYFPARGLYNADGYHYLQAGYNEMGDIAARNIVSGRVQVLQRNSTAARDVYKDDGGIGLNIGVPLGWLHSVGNTTKPAAVFQGPVGFGKTNPTYSVDVADSALFRNALSIAGLGFSSTPSIRSTSFLTFLSNNNLTIFQGINSDNPEIRMANTSSQTVAQSGVFNFFNFRASNSERQHGYFTTSGFGTNTSGLAGNLIFQPGSNYGSAGTDLSQYTDDSVIANLHGLGEFVVNGPVTIAGRLKTNTLQFNTASATDADYTIPSTATFITLPAITANRTATFPTPTAGKILIVWNSNASGNTWNVSGTVIAPDGSSITTLGNNLLHPFIGTGTQWLRYN